MKKPNPQSGLSLISWIIVIVIIIAVLSYFGVNIQQVLTSPTAQGNFSYVWGGVTYVWQNYLASPASYIWNVLIVGIFWNLALQPLLHFLQNLANSSAAQQAVQKAAQGSIAQ